MNNQETFVCFFFQLVGTSGFSLRLILDWSWTKVVSLKEQLDQLCKLQCNYTVLKLYVFLTLSSIICHGLARLPFKGSVEETIRAIILVIIVILKDHKLLSINIYNQGLYSTMIHLKVMQLYHGDNTVITLGVPLFDGGGGTPDNHMLLLLDDMAVQLGYLKSIFHSLLNQSESSSQQGKVKKGS